MRFHLASDCTTSQLVFVSFSSNSTLRSTPFKSSLSPLSFSRKSGAVIRSKLSLSASERSKPSLTALIALSVSLKSSTEA